VRNQPCSARDIVDLGTRLRHELRRNLEQIVDQFGRRDAIVEANSRATGVEGDIDHAERTAGTGKRLPHVRASERVGEYGTTHDDHDARIVRSRVSELRRARVIAVGRNTAWIVFENNLVPQLAAFRKKATHPMLVPGDLVEARTLDAEHVVVDALVPRSFALERHTPGGRMKTMAANIDTLAIVTAMIDPPVHLAMVDRLLAFTEQHGLRPALLLTKADLVARSVVEAMERIYRPLGIPVLVLQPRLGEGIEELRALIASRSAMLIGQSGVGKSSIFGALGGVAVVGDVSRFGQGRQTTTSARLFRMGDGFLIDSPGIGEFSLEAMTAPELASLFVEMVAPSQLCRFSDCRHLAEPGCMVIAAVEAGTIAPSRYASFREIALGEQSRTSE